MPILYDDFGPHDSKTVLLDEEAIDIFLDPGEYFVGDSTFRIRTLLGSCVSIVLWHPRMRYGAMSHCVLSSRKIGERVEDSYRTAQFEGKYVDEVLDLMTQELGSARVPPHECIAKIFGGGNMFPYHPMTEKMNVGRKNGETARQLLRERGFPIAAEDLFGFGHRELIFSVRNGSIWVRQDSGVLHSTN